MDYNCPKCNKPNQHKDMGEDNKCPYCGCVWQMWSRNGYCFKQRMDDLIKDARKTIKQGLEEDEELRFAYQSNIAMLLHDNYGITNHEDRNSAATDILNLIFDMKCSAVDWRSNHLK